jgi:hypothetical protein
MMMRRAAPLLPLFCALALLPMRAVGESAARVSATGERRAVRAHDARQPGPVFDMAILVAVKVANAPPGDDTEEDVRDALVAGLKGSLAADTMKVKVDTADVATLPARCRRIRVTLSCDAIKVTQLVDDNARQIIAQGQLQRVIAVKPVPPRRRIDVATCLLARGRSPDIYNWKSCREELFKNITIWMREYMADVRTRNQGVH